jgi:8-oxo-dGTP pyrophosphatase MutT (NUDIX family)
MCKIYFENRVAILTNKLSKKKIKGEKGLFYAYKDGEELGEIIHLFDNFNKIDRITIYHGDIKKLKTAFFSCFKKIDAAGGIVFNKHNQVLFIKRHGKWDLPKGKVEKGEKIEDAATREVREECGISPLKIVHALGSTFHTYNQNGSHLLKETRWYKMNYYHDPGLVQPQVAENITEVKWIDKDSMWTLFDNSFSSLAGILQKI